jgi:chitin disaccharide deacetylase
MLTNDTSTIDRLLIIHGDDLGMSHSINEANFRALEEGAISSVSVMPTGPWLPEVARYTAAAPSVDVGLHLTLTSECDDMRWRAVSPTALDVGLLDPKGYLHQSVESLFANCTSIREEIVHQLSAMRAVGIDPTHIDSHMMAVMGHSGFLGEYIDLAIRENLVPLLPKRVRASYGVAPSNRLPYVNVIAISKSVPEAAWLGYYLDRIANIPIGLNILVVHLGFDSEELRAVRGQRRGWDAAWRQRDFDAITSKCFKEMIQRSGIKVVNWGEVRDAQGRVL